jgi:hypothetical protein
VVFTSHLVCKSRMLNILNITIQMCILWFKMRYESSPDNQPLRTSTSYNLFTQQKSTLPSKKVEFNKNVFSISEITYQMVADETTRIPKKGA